MMSLTRGTTSPRWIVSSAALALGLALVAAPAGAQQTAKDSAAAADSAAKAAAEAAAKQAACSKVKAYGKQVAADTIKAMWKAGTLFRSTDTMSNQMSVNLPQLTFDQSKAPDSIRTAMTTAGPSCSAAPTPQTMMQLVQTTLAAPRPVIGVQFQPLTARDTAGLGLPDMRGLLVQGVTPGYGAADAGIVKGDVLIALEGKPLVSTTQFLQAASAWKEGQTINLEVVHKGGTHQKVAVVTKMSK